VDGEWVEVSECPHKRITPAVVDVCRCADALEVGLPPVAGGLMDQAESGLAAIEYLKQREGELKRDDGEA
jgi:hypothetical protein